MKDNLIEDPAPRRCSPFEKRILGVAILLAGAAYLALSVTLLTGTLGSVQKLSELQKVDEDRDERIIQQFFLYSGPPWILFTLYGMWVGMRMFQFN